MSSTTTSALNSSRVSWSPSKTTYVSSAAPTTGEYYTSGNYNSGSTTTAIRHHTAIAPPVASSTTTTARDYTTSHRTLSPTRHVTTLTESAPATSHLSSSSSYLHPRATTTTYRTPPRQRSSSPYRTGTGGTTTYRSSSSPYRASSPSTNSRPSSTTRVVGGTYLASSTSAVPVTQRYTTSSHPARTTTEYVRQSSPTRVEYVNRNSVSDAVKDEEIARYKREVNVMQDQLQGVRVEYENRIRNLETELSHRGVASNVDNTITMQRLQRRQEDSDKEITRLEEGLRKEKRDRMTEVTELEGKLSKAQHERRVSEELVQPLRSQNEELSQALMKAKQTRIALEEKLGNVPDGFEATLKSLQQEKEQLPILRKQVADLKDEREVLDGRLNSLEKSHKQLQVEYEQARIKHEQDVSLALTQRRITEERVEPLQHEVDRIKRNLEATGLNAEELRRLKERHEAQIRDLTDSQSRLHTEKEHLKRLLEEAKHSEMHTQITRMDQLPGDRVADLEHDLSMAIHERRLMETEHQELRAEVQRANSHLVSWETERNSLASRAMGAEAAVERLEAERRHHPVVHRESVTTDYSHVHVLQQQKTEMEAELRRYRDLEASRRVLEQRCHDQERVIHELRRQPVHTQYVTAPIRTTTTVVKRDYSGCTPFVGFGLIENDQQDKCQGLQVDTIYKDGPAWNAGLRQGDRVLNIIPSHLEHQQGHNNRELVTELTQVRRLLAKEARVGESVKVVAVKQGSGSKTEYNIPVKTSDDHMKNESNVYFDVRHHEKLGKAPGH